MGKKEEENLLQKDAFPVPNDPDGFGMALLDYFAGQALVGIISNPHTADISNFKYMTEASYSIAEHMLEYRKDMYERRS